MMTLTAILHTRDDERRLARALESLRPCDEFLIVDHGSTDGTLRVAREYAAVIRNGSEASFLEAVTSDWVLCILPGEALSEELEGRLYEWKQDAPADAAAYALRIREETPTGWRFHSPETRLVRRGAMHWNSELPPRVDGASLFAGDLLRLMRAG